MTVPQANRPQSLILDVYLRAIPGSMLILNAANWNAAESKNTQLAPNGVTCRLPFIENKSPISAEVPMTTVIAISTGEKCPLITRDHPNKNSQMKVMAANQKSNIGRTTHLGSSQK